MGTRSSRDRGYAWEHEVVLRINQDVRWKAFRLGGSTDNIPDVIGVNNEQSMMCAIECKAGTGDTLRCPRDEVVRCYDWCNTLSKYEWVVPVVAYKFIQKKGRRGREFFLPYPMQADLSITYGGKPRARHVDGKMKETMRRLVCDSLFGALFVTPD